MSIMLAEDRQSIAPQSPPTGDTPPKPLHDLIAALRPRQWVKNFLVFGAILGAGKVFDADLVRAAAVAFLSFCAASSAGYLLNDVIDRHGDAQHPVKRHRPIAAGRIEPKAALTLAGFLAAGALAVAAGQDINLAAVIAAYMCMQISYCVRLRQVEIIDIFTVAIGFLLRAIAGSIATDIRLTPWFLAVVGFGSLFVVAGKRASEIAGGGAEREGGRKVAKLYTSSFLRTVSMTALAVTMVTYCTWAFGRYEAGGLWPALSVLPFAIAVLRYAQIIDAGRAEAPERAMLSDYLILGSGLCWLALFAAGAVDGPLPEEGRAALNVAAFFLATSAVLYTAWLVALTLRTHRVSELLVTVAVLAGTEVVLLSLLVGAVPGGFAPIPIGIAAIIIALAVHVWRWRAGNRVAVQRALRLLAAGSAHVLAVLRGHPLISIFAGIALLQYGYRVILIGMLPVMDWDGLMYHLIAADMWILDEHIGRTPQSVWTDGYPLTGELFMAWPGLFLRTMRLAALVQLASSALAAIATIGIARRLGARRPYALLAGLFLLSMPVLLAQVNSGLVDIPAAAFALAAVCLTLTFVNPPRRTTVVQLFARVVVIGASIGLAIGVKGTNLVVAATIAAIILVAALRLWHRKRVIAWPTGSVSPRQFVALMVIGLGLSAAAVGSFWYLRTWATHGNPFYPTKMLGFPGVGDLDELFMEANTPPELLGLPMGWLGQLARSVASDLYPSNVIGTHHRIGGLGLAWLPLVLPAAILGVVVAVRRHATNAIAAGAVAITVIVFSPAPWWLRYVMAAIAIVCCFAAVGASALSPRKATAGMIALIALSAIGGWFATTQLAVVHTNDKPWVPSTPGDIVRLALDSERDREVWPWYTYRGIDMLDRDTTIALAYPAPGPFPEPYEQTFLHPLVGTDLRHRVVVLNRGFTTLLALKTELAKVRADYVMVHVSQPIAAEILTDKTGFMRITTDSDRVWGADLYRVGPIPPCLREVPKLTIESSRAGTGKVHLNGKLTDGCGAPMRGLRVEVWRGDAGRPQWTAEEVVMMAETDDDGRITVNAPGTSRAEDRFFLRWPGDASRSAAASAIVNARWRASP